MLWSDGLLFVIFTNVPSLLNDLGGEPLQHTCHEDSGGAAGSFTVAAVFNEAIETADGEDKTDFALRA